MAKKSTRPRELELLGQKVREAKELVGQLRESNRSLTSELAELKGRLEGVESSAGPAAENKSSPPRRQSESVQSAQLDLLRRERKEIREKISHLLEKLEAGSSSSSDG